MLTLLQQPGTLSLSRNPVVVRLGGTTGGDDYAYTGRTAGFVMSNSFEVQVGESVQIDWTEPSGLQHTILFTGAAVPSANDEIYTDAGAYPSYLAYWQAIAERISEHPEISPHFTLYCTQNILEITMHIVVKEYSDDWALAFSYNGDDLGLITFTETAPATNYPDNYSCRLDVFFEDEYNGNTWNKVAELSQGPTSDATFTFDLSSVLDAEMKRTLPTPPIPAFSDDEPVLADIIRRFYFRYYEVYDDAGTIDYEVSSTKKVLAGGIAQTVWADYDFFDALGADNSLLTWYPDGKSVSPEQPEWLAWYNYIGSAKSIVIETLRRTQDGLQTVLYKYESLDTVPNGEVLLIPVGFNQLGLDAESTDNPVLQYWVRVIDATSDYEGGSPVYLSQSRTFYLDHCHYEELRYLMYLNGFSCPLTLRCIGDFTNKLKVSRDEAWTENDHATVIVEPDYTSALKEQFQTQYDYDNYFTYRSGYLSRFEVDALQELVIYNQLWEVYEEGFMPLLIQNKDFPIHVTRQYLHSIDIETIPALKQKNYSNINIPMTEEQEGWALVAADYWRTVYGLIWELA